MRAILRQAIARRFIKTPEPFVSSVSKHTHQCLGQPSSRSPLADYKITRAATARQSSYISEDARTNFTEDVRAASSKSGSITVIIGPMFAGKTKELLRNIDHYKSKGIQPMVIKSDKDNRYDASRLSTHDGHTRECYAVARLFKVKELFCSTYKTSEVIIIDEAQFFPDLHEFCCTAADEDDKTVIVAGLSGDFQRQRFGQIIDLIPHADKITHLEAECCYCKTTGSPRPAIFTVRIAADNRQEVVGGADKYAPVCRKHYNIFSGIRRAKLEGGSQAAKAVS